MDNSRTLANLDIYDFSIKMRQVGIVRGWG